MYHWGILGFHRRKGNGVQFRRETFLLMDSTIYACFMHCLNKAPQQSNNVITQQFIQDQMLCLSHLYFNAVCVGIILFI